MTTESKKEAVQVEPPRCAICGKPITHVRARVIGYFSDEFNWNPVRQKHDAPNRHYSDKSELAEFGEE